MRKLKYDAIGYWSEIKLEIIKEYAAAYTSIMSAQSKPPFKYIYIDAFAGAGQHISRKTGEYIPGSPLNALNIEKPFKEYHFIDLEDAKVAELEKLSGERQDVSVYHGNCNEILPIHILPRAEFKQYRRALCILDPYGLHLNWEIIKIAGQMKSVEIFLNFPIMDINMNILKHDRSKAEKEQIERMNAFWGDESWNNIGYEKSKQLSLLGERADQKTTNEALEAGFRKRLKEVAGFAYVPKPMPMRNKNNAVVYYLYFASQKPVAVKIVQEIFRKHSSRKDS